MLVEGHGEANAAGNLVTRLWHDAGAFHPWAAPLRWKNLHQRRGITQGVERVRANRDAGALLILRDEEDACPKERAPEMADAVTVETDIAACDWVHALRPPFPVAVVLLRPEYEVLFLPSIDAMAGRPLIGPDGQARAGIVPGTRFEEDWEAKRGVKEWLSARFPPGRSYKPSLDQLPMTRMIDIPTLRAASVPCFGTLERALRFLIDAFGGEGVYPPGRANL